MTDIESWQTHVAEVNGRGERAVWLFDKDMEPLVRLPVFYSLAYGDSVNEVDSCEVEIPADDPAVTDLLHLDYTGAPRDMDALLHESLWVVIQTSHYRAVYRVAEIELLSGGSDGDRVKIIGESLFEHINHISLWANPGSSLSVQLKYSDVQAGDSLRVVKDFLLRNLARMFQPSMISSWNLWHKPSWRNVQPDQWPILVNPVNATTSSEWTVLDSRFSMAGDIFTPTLNAAGLLMTFDLWLPGDAQPFPDYARLTRPTIVIDVVPRAFDTSATGRVTDVIRGVKAKIARGSTHRAVVLDDTAFTGRNPHAWVVWRPDDMRNVSTRLVIKKSTDSSVIVGGRSPQIVNTLISASSSALWRGLGAQLSVLFPPMAGIVTAAATFGEEITKNALRDKFFAWNQFNDTTRAQLQGRFRYRELARPGEAWSVSTLQKAWGVFEQTDGSISTEFTVGDGAPYLVGRDFVVGDQAAVTVQGINFGTYIHSWRVNVTRGGDDVEVGLGDPRNRESPERALNNTLKSVGAVIDRVKTVVL